MLPRRSPALVAALLMFIPTLLSPTDAHGGTDIFQGTAAVYDVAWNPQGTVLAAGTAAGNLTLYDGVTHVTIRSWHAHDGPINQVVFSPDGGRIASVSGAYRNPAVESRLKVWTVEGVLLLNLTGHRDWITSVVWSPDGATLATASGVDDHVDLAGAYGEVFFWNATVGTLAWNASPLPSYPVRLDWSPDGRRVASIGHLNDIWLLDPVLRDMHLINATYHDPAPPPPQLAPHASHGWAIAWAPNSRLLAAGFSRDVDDPPDGLTDIGTVVIIDANEIDASGLALHVRQAGVHTKPTEWVGWDSTGTYVASCSGVDILGSDGRPGQDGDIDGGELVIYNNSASTSTLKGMNVFIGGRSWCASLAWRPGNLTVATGNADGSVRLYVLDEDRDGCFVWEDAAPQDPNVCVVPQAQVNFLEGWGLYVLGVSIAAAVAVVVVTFVRSRGGPVEPEESNRRRRARRPSR